MGTWDGTGVRAIEPVARDGDLPPSYSQERMWFLDQLLPDSGIYNTPYAFRVHGPVDADALGWALTEIVRRHEILRTTYHVADGRLRQRVRPPAPVPLRRVDLAARPADLDRLVEDEARRPFDLGADLALRAALFDLGADGAAVLLNQPHIASDGWSLGLLTAELDELYAARLRGEPSPLPELAVQYGDYAAWLRRRDTGHDLEAQLAYWRRQLADLPDTCIPADRPRPPVQSYRGDRYFAAVPPEVAEAVRRTTRQAGTTPFVTLLTAFGMLVAKLGGRTDVVLGTPVAGRGMLDLEPMLGCFLNTLVLRLDLAADPSVRRATAQVRRTVLDAFAHQDVVFEKLVQELRPGRDLARAPLFQVMFILQNATAPQSGFAGLPVTPLDIRGETAKCDLVFSVEESAEGLGVTVEYAVDLFDRETVARLCDGYVLLLAAMTADPDARMSELPGARTAAPRPDEPGLRRTEAAGLLATLPGAKDAAVDARGRAYIVPDGAAGAATGAATAAHGADWRVLFDGAYGQSAGGRDAEAAGWVDSFTRKPFTEPEMAEWIDGTLAWVRRFRPRRILELGCGSGLIGRRLAAEAGRYVGTDFSAPALREFASRLAGAGVPDDAVELRCQGADDLTGVEGDFDVVLINSVAQYFPGPEYLTDVLGGAVEKLADGGVLLVGDVRNGALDEAFHAAVELHRAGPGVSRDGPGVSRAGLRAAVAARREAERELVVAPAYFREFAARHDLVTGVDIEVRRGVHPTEMNRYRYNAALWVGDVPACEPAREVGWDAVGDVAGLARVLGDADVLHVAGVPNPRVAADLRGLEEHPYPDGPDPEILRETGARHGFEVVAGWLAADGADGTYEALFRRAGGGPAVRTDGPPPPSDPRWAARHTNAPARARAHQDFARRAYHDLERLLPDAEPPAEIRIVRRLPARDATDDAIAADTLASYTPPARHADVADLDALIAELWRRVLGHADFGRDDNFFEVGGHSLLLVQLRELLADQGRGRPPSLMDLFRYPTVAGLARYLAGAAGPAADPASGPGAADAMAQRRAARGRQRTLRETRARQARRGTS
ncbi:condensation domain-containing protein [Actinomadura sp. 1N219]|uniref:condensation domain-containing protein n=1 Tax=Actinomadura sp. 1N219 TaxID=3375152 RepID=UPI00379656D7